MKINFLDKIVLKKTFNIFLIITTVIGFFALFFNQIIEQKMIVLTLVLILTILTYIYFYVKANNLKCIKLKILNSDLEIKIGDIFKQDGLKVINFNEYFDTKVDDLIIAKNSLNGIFINNFLDDFKIIELNKKIDSILKETQVNQNRKSGKKKKYNLGEIIEYEGFLLTSLTKFDEDNRANLNLKEYLEFLMNFWNNLDKIYANRSVSITLFGSSSITRFNDAYEINEEELLNIIIWSFRISKIKFKYPNKISIILSKDIANKINLNQIKEVNK